MNPRESMLENLMDEFSTKQTQSLQFSSAMDSSMTMSLSSHNSIHSSSGSGSGSSTHSMSASAHGALVSLSLFATTSSDMEQLGDLLARMRRIYRDFDKLHYRSGHGQGTSSSRQSGRPASLQGDGFTSSTGTSSSSSSAAAETGGVAGSSSGGGGGSAPYQLVLPPSAEEVAICFREVPELFFKSEFSLTSPDTFAQTLGEKAQLQLRANHSETNRQRQMTANSQYQPQQERLSRYLDLVEVALLKHIWSRSPAFFRALDDIKGLQVQVVQASSCLARLRTKLQALDGDVASGAMRIPQMHCRQKNESALADKITCIQRVLQSRGEIQYLLEEEDYLGALDVIHESKILFADELVGLLCVRHVGQQLDEYDEFVCEIMCNKFVSLAIQWEEDGGGLEVTAAAAASSRETNSDSEARRRNIANDTLGGIAGTGSSNEAGGSLGEQGGEGSAESAALEQLLLALLKSERLTTALGMYKSRLSDAVKLIVRTCVQEYLSPDADLSQQTMQSLLSDGPSSATSTAEGVIPSGEHANDSQQDTPFAQRVKEMSHDNFLSCLSMSYEHLLLALSRSERVEAFILFTLRKTHNLHDADVDNSGDKQPAPSFAEGADARVAVESVNVSSTGGDTADADTPSSSSPSTSTTSAAASASTTKSRAANANNSSLIIALSKSCLAAACDLGQRSVAQLLGLRRDANARMGLEKMKFLWETSLHFVLTLEGLSGSTAYVFRQCLLTQTRSFLDYMHETMKGKLVNTLDCERWTQCDVSTQRQQDIDRLTSGKAFLPQPAPSSAATAAATTTTVPNELDGGNSTATANATTTGTSDAVGGSDGGSGSGSGTIQGSTSSSNLASSSASASATKKKEVKPVTVDGSSFKVVWSSLLLTEVVLGYLEISFSFAPVTTDVIMKSVELLKLFDSRTKQLVLGAQAIQSAARLKSISAKHLAVTAQSINMLAALLPHVRAALLAQLPPKHHIQLTELDRVSHTLIDHHGQIVAKFVSIVGDFVDHSASRLRLVDWDTFAGSSAAAAVQMQAQSPSQPVPGQSQSQTATSCDYFEEIQRNINALHRVLVETLPPEQIQDVFSRIFALLNRRIPTHFEEIMPATQTGRQRILDEVTHLVGAFSRLKLIDAMSATSALEETFRRRYGNHGSGSS